MLKEFEATLRSGGFFIKNQLHRADGSKVGGDKRGTARLNFANRLLIQKTRDGRWVWR